MGRPRKINSISKLNEAEFKSLNNIKKLISYFTDDYDALSERLFFTFGSAEEIFIADKTELMKIEGITEKISDFLCNFQSICKDYFSGIYSSRIRVFNSETAYNYFKTKFIGLKNECIALMVLNSHGYILFNDIISEGSMNIVPVYIKEIIRLCIEYDTDTVLIAHNHPGGSPIPSSNDIKSTREIQLALEGIYVSLFDHIIIADDDYFSMRSSGWLKDITGNADDFRRGLLEME